MDPFLKTSIVLIYIYIQWCTAESLHCLSCTDTVSPIHCHLIRKCPAGDVCYIEQFRTVNGEKLYNMGCYTERICHDRQMQARKRQLSHLTGSENPHCVHCCKSDACNVQGCQSTGFPIQHGPLCFNCKQSTNPELCRYVKVCEFDQVCHLHEEEEFGDKFYVSSCLLQNECEVGVTVTDAFGKRTINQKSSMCCNSDLCNIGLACPAGKYGRTCMSNCGHCINRTCDSMSGACVNGCSAGWTGSNCTQPCAAGTFGNKCSFNCGHCSDGGTCNSIDGTCPHGCSAGWTGSFCKQTCPNGTFGEGCRQSCGHCENKTCDAVNGSCPNGCSRNWIGRFCNEFFRPIDCLDILKVGKKTSGVYRIHPWNNTIYKEVQCDMDLMGGGWTVIQHRDRGNPDVNFNTTWKEYKKGFGDVRGNYWLGNDVIHELTTTFRNDLYIRMKNTNNQSFEVKYASFSISAENDGYRLSLGTKLGNITDAFRSYNVVGYPFHTYDRDTEMKCVRQCGSGWWYHYCTKTNLNIPFSNNRAASFVWYPLIIYGVQLSNSEMLIRRH